MRYRGGTHVGARARSAHAIGAERAARGRDRAAAGARARSAHAIGAERVARGGDGSQRLRRPAHRRAAPSARSAVRRARSARRRSGSPQAPGAQSAHATGAERVARGGASWHAVAQPAQAAHAADAGRLLPASAALTTNIVVWPQTMSPAPCRRPPITRMRLLSITLYMTCAVWLKY